MNAEENSTRIVFPTYVKNKNKLEINQTEKILEKRKTKIIYYNRPASESYLKSYVSEKNTRIPIKS